MITCILYNEGDHNREEFMLSELSTLEVTTLLDASIKIQDIQVFSHAGNAYLEEDLISNFDTIKAFNAFFMSNPQFHIHDCNLQLGNGVAIASHDDSEVHIEQPINFEERMFIKKVLRINGLSELLILEVMSNPGCYLSLSEEGTVIAVHKTFEDYLKSSN